MIFLTNSVEKVIEKLDKKFSKKINYRKMKFKVKKYSIRKWLGETSCTYKKAASSKKDEIYLGLVFFIH